MSLSRPAYRLRVYGTDDATVLTPAAGAPHTNEFKVASIGGVAGYQPYLGELHGGSRRGRIDPLTKRVDTGQWTFSLLDRRTGGPGSSNLERWLTAFLADATGTERLKGCKVEVDESLDAGVTWTLAFTGRLHQLRLDRPLWYQVVIRDTSDELSTMRCFVGPVHSSISYAARVQSCPLGITAAYSTQAAGPPLLGVMSSAAGGFLINEGPLGRSHALNVVTTHLKQLTFVVGGFPNGIPIVAGTEQLRAQVKRLDTMAVADFRLKGVATARRSDGTGHSMVYGGILAAIEGGAALPPNATNIEIRLYAVGEATKDAPILLNDVHPVQLWKDLLDGKFGRLHADGTVVRTYPYDGSAFTALINDATIGVARFRVTASSHLHDWIEKNLLQAYNLAYRVDTQGRIVPIDMRLPTSLGGLATITDAELREGGEPSWATDRADALTRLDLTFYQDETVTDQDIANNPDELPDIPVGRLNERPYTLVRPGDPRPTLGERRLEIDAKGWRFAEREIREGQKRLDWLERQASGMLEELARRFGPGPMDARVPARRSAVTNGLTPGGWALVQLTKLPDPSTNRRGGTRLMQVLERSEHGLEVDLLLLDSGLSVTSAAPTVGTLGQESNNTRHGITAPITVNASTQPVRIEIAITDTGTGTAPAADSSAWVFAARATATGTMTIRNLPAGKRVWVRARSESATPLQYPSAWTFSTGTDYVDTATVPACTSVANSGVTGNKATVTWTVGDADLPVEVLYCTPSSGTPALVETLRPGSARRDFYALTPNVSHKVQVRHPDPYSGYSATAETTFTTSSTPDVAPAPGGIAVLVGRDPLTA